MNPNQAHQGSKTHPGGNLAAVDEPHGGAEPVTQQAGRFLPASRCRHPGDVIRLILSAVVLTGTLAAVAVAHRRLLSPGAAAVTWPGSGPAGRLLTGSVQLAFVVAAAGIAAAALRRRRDHRDRRRLPRRRTHRRRLPHPGGLGAIEAALVAGLTGIGIARGPAVSAVLTYRLATYWLPVLPGWICLRILQKRDYI